jgi:hypothetical protein
VRISSVCFCFPNPAFRKTLLSDPDKCHVDKSCGHQQEKQQSGPAQQTKQWPGSIFFWHVPAVHHPVVDVGQNWRGDKTDNGGEAQQL